jgi:hypothetical protein
VVRKGASSGDDEDKCGDDASPDEGVGETTGKVKRVHDTSHEKVEREY